MARKIIIHKECQDKILALIDYIGEEFGAKAAVDFAVEIEVRTNRLIEFPEIGRKSEKAENVRMIRIGKYTSLFYSFNKTRIELLHLFDQRQHPDKSKY